MQTPSRGDYRHFDQAAKDQELQRLRGTVAEYENVEAVGQARYAREVQARQMDAATADYRR